MRKNKARLLQQLNLEAVSSPHSSNVSEKVLNILPKKKDFTQM